MATTNNIAGLSRLEFVPDKLILFITNKKLLLTKRVKGKSQSGALLKDKKKQKEITSIETTT